MGTAFYVHRYVDEPTSYQSCWGINAVIDFLKGDKITGEVNLLEKYSEKEIEELKQFFRFPDFKSFWIGDKKYGFEVLKSIF